jgi:hypothetical protein
MHTHRHTLTGTITFANSLLETTINGGQHTQEVERADGPTAGPEQERTKRGAKGERETNNKGEGRGNENKNKKNEITERCSGNEVGTGSRWG